MTFATPIVPRETVEAMSPLAQKDWYRATTRECQEVFREGHIWLTDTRQLSSNYRQQYQRDLVALMPGGFHDEPVLTYDATAVWARAVQALRSEAIDRSTSMERKFQVGRPAQYCISGLNQFLGACGLEQVTR